jgi:hypothetical protein
MVLSRFVFVCNPEKESNIYAWPNTSFTSTNNGLATIVQSGFNPVAQSLAQL